ncbi:MAG TPA: hypothetical protein DEQ02_07770 [Ruminococcaceae bacterium]|nr:hypothetical protein [Oscillospiraceae bacterium]
MKKYITLLIVTVALITCSALAPGIYEQGIPKVDKTAPFAGSIVTTVTSNGIVEGSKMSVIMLNVPVMIDEILFEVGDKVEKGDPLFTVDRDATVESIARGAGELEMLSEYRDILSDRGLSGSTYEEIQSQIDEIIKQQKAVQMNLLPKTITAPMSGKIIESKITDYTLNSANQSLITIMDGSQMRVRTEIGEDIISQVEMDMPAVISGTGFKGKEFSGTVTKIYPTASEVMGTGMPGKAVETLVDINNPDESIKPGYSAKVEIVTDIGEDIMIVPYEAVAQDEENRQYVYILKNGFAFKQYIITGREGDDGIEVLSGLQYSDFLMLNPGAYTADYLRIKVRGE